MLFSEATGRQVVSTSTAVTVGRIEEFVVDPKGQAVLALKVKRKDSGDTLLWSDITKFGPDAVTVSGDQAITDPGPEVTALTGKEHRVVGKRVLTSKGDDLGMIKDVEFNPDSGSITALILADEEIAGVRLVGVGSYAVVVQSE